jgi:activator of Hsp90 ATPase-like protein
MIFEEVGRQTDADQQVVTVTLADLGGKTELVLTQVGILDEEDFKGLEGGYGSFLDKLAELLAKS